MRINLDLSGIGEWLLVIVKWAVLLFVVWFLWSQSNITNVRSACNGTTRVYWMDKTFGGGMAVLPNDLSCLEKPPQIIGFQPPAPKKK